MQVKVSPLNPDPKNEGQFVESANVSYPQLAEGKMRIRVAFLPMNEQQHAMLAELLPKSMARIVAMCADGLIEIVRQDHPALPPKVHMLGSPLWMDIEIGPPANQPATEEENLEPTGPAPQVRQEIGATAEHPAGEELAQKPADAPKEAPKRILSQLRDIGKPLNPAEGSKVAEPETKEEPPKPAA